MTRDHLVLAYPPAGPLPLVTAVVATRDKASLLRTCLAGLLHRTDYPALEVLVMDNGSVEPDTHRYFESLATERRVRIVSCPGPFNFAQINNIAAAHAGGEILALLNNDLDVMKPDWLRVMVSHALRPRIGVVGAKLHYPSERIQHAGVVMGLNGGADHIFRGLWSHDPGPHRLLGMTHNVAVVTGACMVLRRSVYDEVGGMDTAYAVDFNDVDLCLRIRERGYEVVWTPGAELYHLESMSRSRDRTIDQEERTRREIALLKRRWGHWIDRDPYYNPNLALDTSLRGLAFPPRVRPPWLSADNRPGA